MYAAVQLDKKKHKKHDDDDKKKKKAATCMDIKCPKVGWGKGEEGIVSVGEKSLKYGDRRLDGVRTRACDCV